MRTFIPALKPRIYLTKKVNGCCGAYAAHNVLSAFTKKKLSSPESLLDHYFVGRFGWMLPYQMKNILADHGLKVKSGSARNSPKKISLLERFVNEGPTIIAIDLVDREINPFLGRLLGHWIVLWGFDSGKKEFYCYDSRKRENGLPVGNCKYSYDDILKLWGRDFIPSPFTYLYVRVKIT